jgi:hypothetical protein
MDQTKPTDQDPLSTHAGYIRETRSAVNALSSGSGVGKTDLTVALGTVALTVGTELGLFGHETVIMSGAGAAAIATIHGGVDGQIKVFIAQDNNVSFVDGVAGLGHIYLNQLPALSSFAMQLCDVLALVNIGGDGGVNEGYWKELYRQVALK